LAPQNKKEILKIQEHCKSGCRSIIKNIQMNGLRRNMDAMKILAGINLFFNHFNLIKPKNVTL